MRPILYLVLPALALSACARTETPEEARAAAQAALAKVFGREPVLIREGGSIPIIQDFKEVLGADTLLLGLALPDCQIHAPNENFTVGNFEAGIRLNRVLLEELASNH